MYSFYHNYGEKGFVYGKGSSSQASLYFFLFILELWVLRESWLKYSRTLCEEFMVVVIGALCALFWMERVVLCWWLCCGQNSPLVYPAQWAVVSWFLKSSPDGSGKAGMQRLRIYVFIMRWDGGIVWNNKLTLKKSPQFFKRMRRLFTTAISSPTLLPVLSGESQKKLPVWAPQPMWTTLGSKKKLDLTRVIKSGRVVYSSVICDSYSKAVAFIPISPYWGRGHFFVLHKHRLKI